MTNVPEEEENPGHWSLFAGTLADILGTPQHGETPLSRLDNLRERPGEELDPEDPRSPRELVHREKVRRLIYSLQVPGTFPLLSRDDLERIRRYFHLDHEESLRLQAAIIATQVQRMVYGRFGAKSEHEGLRAAAAALNAAQLHLPTLMEAARQLAGVNDELEKKRKSWEAFDGTVGSIVLPKRRRHTGKDLDMVPEKESMQDQYDEQPFVAATLGKGLEAIDRGTLALHLGYSASGLAEQLAEARTARDAFADALERLDRQHVDVKSSEAWQFWQAEARSGFHDADELCG